MSLDSVVEQETTPQISDKQLLSVIDGRPLYGELVHIEDKILGEGRESQVFKATLKVGDRELPVVAKQPKQDRRPNDISIRQIDEVRRELEKDRKFPMPYVYGKTTDGLLIQEYIPGTTLERKLIADPGFINDTKRLELIQMALEIGSAVEKKTEGKYTLKGLSPDDILVAESDNIVKVKYENKLICVDPSIVRTFNERGYRENSILESEANLFTDTLFESNSLYDDTYFRFKYEYKTPGGVVEPRGWTAACFVKKPEDLEVPRQGRFDLVMLDKESAKQNFRIFCSKNNIEDSRLVNFLFEVYHSENARFYGRDDARQEPKFTRESTLRDFKAYLDSL